MQTNSVVALAQDLANRELTTQGWDNDWADLHGDDPDWDNDWAGIGDGIDADDDGDDGDGN